MSTGLEIIRFLVERYYDVQKLRTSSFNGIVAYVRSHDNSEDHNPIASRQKFEDHSYLASRRIDENQGEYAESEGPKDKPSILAHSYISGKIKPPKAIEELVWFHNSLHSTEKNLAKRLDAWSAMMRVRTLYLSRIKGIGPILSSGLIAWIAPISRFNNVSNLWAYAGLSTHCYEHECNGHTSIEEGKKIKKVHRFIASHEYTICPVKIGKKRVPCGAGMKKMVHIDSPPRRKGGYLLLINMRLRTLCWKVAKSFEKQNARTSIFRRMYDETKARYQARPDLKDATKGRIENMTLRYIAKQFLSDLWVTWRTLEGLPVTEPYAVRIPGHGNYRRPEVDRGPEEI